MSKRLEQGRCKVVATSAFCNGVNVCLFLAFYYTVYTVQLYVLRTAVTSIHAYLYSIPPPQAAKKKWLDFTVDCEIEGGQTTDFTA